MHLSLIARRFFLATFFGMLFGSGTAAESLFSHKETEQPNCNCCFADPGGKCCQSSGCNIEAMQTGKNEIGAGLAAPAEKLETVLGPPVDHLRSCVLKNELGLDKTNEAGIAKEFFALPSVNQCDAFLPDLLEQRFDMLAAERTGGVTPAMRDLAKTYTNLCLSPPTSVYKPVLNAAQVKRIAERTMLLVGEDAQPYCHGFRLNNFIVTADHCLAGNTVGAKLTVRTLEEPALLVATVTRRGGQEQGRVLARDYALLTLDKPMLGDSAADAAWLDQPIENSRLFIDQLNIYALMAANAPASGDLAGFTTNLDNPFCRLLKVAGNGFLLNACQSEEGTSGAAYIQADAAGHLRLIGVHAGPTDKLGITALSDCSIWLGNYGVSLPVDELRKIVEGQGCRRRSGWNCELA